MDKKKMSIWGRDFELDTIYECHKGEDITPEQIKAYNCFASNPDWLENAKLIVEEYAKVHVLSDNTNTKKESIFSYVIPDYIFITRYEEKPRVALMCKYKYEPEHGLAIVFADTGEIEVGIQDIIL